MKFPLPPNSKDGPPDGRVSRSSRSSNKAVRKISQLVYLPALILILFFLCLTAAGQERTRRVLILTGSDPNHPGFSIITRTRERHRVHCAGHS